MSQNCTLRLITPSRVLHKITTPKSFKAQPGAKLTQMRLKSARSLSAAVQSGKGRRAAFCCISQRKKGSLLFAPTHAPPCSPQVSRGIIMRDISPRIHQSQTLRLTHTHVINAKVVRCFCKTCDVPLSYKSRRR
jgi:hypothetical protein